MRIPALNICALCLALALGPAAAQLPQPLPEGAAAPTRSEELEAVRNRILTSLLYRGQVADIIMESGMAHELVAVEDYSTHSDQRLALIFWIEKNPDKAARLALRSGAGVKYTEEVSSYTIESWRISSGFMSRVRELAAASKDSSVSSEALELAAHRLFAGSGLGEGAVEVRAGGGGDGGGNAGARSAASDFFSLGNTDFSLNRAGLDRELAGAGEMLESMRGQQGRGPAGAERAYAAAVRSYGDFLVAAASVKGREKITAAESAALEARRAGLQTGLSALAVRMRAADADNIRALLQRARSRPGGAALLAAAAALRTALDAEAERVETGTLSRKEQFSAARRIEEAFAAFYIKYSVYAGLLGLKVRYERTGYSCLYDYLLSRWLARFCPAAAYARSRAVLRAAADGLDEGLGRAGAGELEAALSGPGGRAEELGAHLALVEGASARNRAAQYFLWDIVLWPVSVGVEVNNGRAVFRPEFSFYGVVGPKPGAPNLN